MEKANPLAGRKIALRAAVGIALLLAVFFIPAGSFRWSQAWIFLGLYLATLTWLFLWGRRRDPALLRERMSPKKNVKSWDRIILRIYSVFLVGLVILAGLDAVRFHWSYVPLGLNLLGFGGLLLAALLIFWVMKENTFASSVVRIQTDRGQRVCSTGPYAYVRHPMYVAIIVLMICLPAALGSLFAFIPSVIIVLLFVLRTSLEDKTLKEELPGYREYAQTVRFRLIPGLW